MKINVILIAAILAITGCSAKGDTASQQRSSIQSMRGDTLNKLYKLHPESRKDIQSSVGYAVFSNSSSKILVVGFGSGYGVVKDKTTGRDTYMKMAQAGAGLGMGVKELRTVLVFHDRTALNKFITEGFVVGADANAAAKYENKGVAPVGVAAKGVANTSNTKKPLSKVNVYEITEKGLAAQAMVNGYKYWRDDELN